MRSVKSTKLIDVDVRHIIVAIFILLNDPPRKTGELRVYFSDLS